MITVQGKGVSSGVAMAPLRFYRRGSKDGNRFTEPVILAADDLAPSETIQLDKSMILGFVTGGGSDTCHTAILARSLDLPAVIGADEVSVSPRAVLPLRRKIRETDVSKIRAKVLADLESGEYGD